MISQNVFIVAAKRTPFGTFGGSLKKVSANELALLSAQATVGSIDLDPALIDNIFLGNVIQSSNDSIYGARHMGLKLGVPEHVPALMTNRLCGSGFETVIQGAESILLGQSSLCLVGGTENMSQTGFSISGDKVRWGVPLGGNLQLEDNLWSGLTDTYAGIPMAMTAENLAEQYGISRDDCDEYAYRSQTSWKAALDGGIFDDEIAPVEVPGKKGTVTFSADEHPRPEVSLEKMKSLPPVFKRDGTVSAGNASGICDGAGTLLVASEEVVQQHNLKPLARLVGWARVGCDPKIMGIGPVAAIRNALSASNLTIDQMDLVEINEAFAAQYLACEKELGLDRAKSNKNGGAIAIGHPLGASGARITGHLAHALQREENARYAVGSACIGGGQGIAVVMEKC
jgi:acetyl-CoA acyltransferase 2